MVLARSCLLTTGVTSNEDDFIGFAQESSKSIHQIIYCCTRYILSAIFDFHKRLSSEIKNNIINGFVDYIITRNGIKHDRVIYNIAYFWYLINSIWLTAAILDSKTMKVTFVVSTSKTFFGDTTKRFRCETNSCLENKCCL